MKVKIYAMTHKKFETPINKMYIPLQVGAATHDKLGYLCDDVGENISKQNCYFAELTGVYWMWKNEKEADYLGVCHYRRYLLNAKGKLFQESEIEKILKTEGYDIITTKKVILDHSYYEGFSGRHNIQDLIETQKAIEKLCPEYLSTYIELVNKNETYFGNMMITDKRTFDKYAEWLFTIFHEVQKYIDPSKYDNYRMRVYGFISEFLLYVWTVHNKLNSLECDVAVIGEKKETQETKEQLKYYFDKGDIIGAKKYFMEIYQKRPDILMEASDFDGSLKLAMQAISTAEYEKMEYGNSIICRYKNYEKSLAYIKDINKLIQKIKVNEKLKLEKDILEEKQITRVALRIAAKVLCNQKQFEKIENELMQCYRMDFK